MKFLNFLVLTLILGFSKTALSSFEKLADTKLYQARFITTNFGNDNGQYKSGILIKTHRGKRILLHDQEEQFLPQIYAKPISNIQNIKIEKLESQQDNSMLFIPVAFDLKNKFVGGEIAFEIQFSICGKNCFPARLDVVANVKSPDNDYEAHKFLQEFRDDVANDNLVWILVLAFLGGLILNVMPCVLPVLSLKIFSIIKLGGRDKSLMRTNFFATSAGIIVTFLVIGIGIAMLRSAGEYAGIGLHFQEPYFVTSMILILILFAISISGQISLTLPARIRENILKIAPNNGALGSFSNGVLATILATPCTAPLIGAAITFAITNGPLTIMQVFLFMGFGMASPFICLAFSDKLQKMIPKPGEWMNWFKKFLEILIYLTVIWLLYVLSKLLNVESAAILFLCTILLKFILTNSANILSRFFLKPVLILIILLGSYYLPFQYAKNNQGRQENIEKIWKKFSMGALDKAIAEDKIILVDITADWCITCQYNKFTVLNNSYVMEYLHKNKVATLRGNYTQESKDLNRFLSMHNRYAIPLNVVYSKSYPEGIILPPILTPNKLIHAINKAKTK